MNHLRTITTFGLANFVVILAVALLWRAPVPAGELVGRTAVASRPTTPVPASFGFPPEAGAGTNPAPMHLPAPANNRCLITIQGKRYDVTSLRSTHSGGDVFQCGADMTATFFGQHNQTLLDTTMRQYLIP